MKSTYFFAKTPPLKLFFATSIPGMVSMLASSLYQTIDGVFVGQFLGATAFAAINLAMPFVVINFALADLIGVGSAVPISVCLGKKQGREANNIFTCSCLLIIATGAVVGGALFAAAPLLIQLMGAQGDFAQLATQYLRVYAICSPLTTIVYALDNYANMESKLKRCREKGPAEEHLTDRELKQKIQSVDRRRAKFYELYTGSPWRNMENFDVCVNTTHVSVRAWVPFLASLVESEK